MALFQRIKSPLAENRSASEAPGPAGPRSAGEVLRQQREALGLDLDDLARTLRIKPAYLAALEEGRPDRLPGPAYAVGFARAYSDHLGLDSAEVLRRFKSEGAGLDARPDLSFPMPLGERSMPGGGMLALALILAICAYTAWYYLSAGERARPPRVTEVPTALLAPKPASAPPPASAPAAAPSAPMASGGGADRPTAQSVPAGEKPPSTVMPASISSPATAPAISSPAMPNVPTTQAAPAAGVGRDVPAGPAPASQTETARVYGAADGPARIILRATADSWVQIRGADRSVLFTGVLKPGDTYRVPDQPGLRVRAGNAGGLEVTVDGKPAPALGPPGAVRDAALDPQSLAAPSAGRD